MAERVVPGTQELPSSPALASDRATPYAYYALFLLALANFFNYVDRHIVAIVGQQLKTDLALTDAQLGFLLGTSFAVFYGVVGIAMGRIADAISRTRLMAFGLALWSAMTALAGVANGFAGIAAARLGVGIGEATANPCSHSLLSDFFPARNRSAVLSVYLLGTHLGLAASLIGGGLLLQHWHTLCRSFPDGACGIDDWRAAFFVVGLPGILLALLVATLREPPRVVAPRQGGLLRLIATEMSAAVPPFTLLNLRQVGGSAAVIRNLLFATVLVLAAIGLSMAIGDWPQWAAVALGVYSVTTWARVLKYRDAPLYRLTFGDPTFRFIAAGSALTACMFGAVSAWSAPYAIRVLGATPGQVGLALGAASATAAALSVIAGGLITDWWKRRDRRAPVWITLIALIAPVPAFLAMLAATDLSGFVLAVAIYILIGSIWGGAIAALVQDLVLPRMRGTAAAAFSLLAILIGSGVGPYWVGKISSVSGSLATGLYSILALVPVAALLLVIGALRLGREKPEARWENARAVGEPIG